MKGDINEKKVLSNKNLFYAFHSKEDKKDQKVSKLQKEK